MTASAAAAGQRSMLTDLDGPQAPIRDVPQRSSRATAQCCHEQANAVDDIREGQVRHAVVHTIAGSSVGFSKF